MSVRAAQLNEGNSNLKSTTEILILTINLGESKDDIVIHEFDDPNILAQNFCKKHSLNSQVETTLTAHIISNLEKVLQDKSNQRIPNLSDEEFYDFTPKINEKFKRILTQKPRILVYDRLQKQKSDISLTSYDNKTPRKNFQHPGNRLYENGLRLQQERQKKSMIGQEQKIKTELAQATFKPKINPAPKKTQNTENELMYKGILQKQNLKLKINELLESERRKCTFTPEVNSTSSRLASRDRSTDRINYLYKEAEEKSKKIEKLSQEYFNEICPFSLNASTNKPKVDLNTSVERLVNSKEKVEKTLEKLRKNNIVNEFRDKVTGQEFFKPQIIRGPKTQREKSNVWEDLYNRRSDSQERLSISPQKSFKNLKSEKIIKKITAERYYEIFNKLKPTKGKISWISVDPSDLEPDMLTIIMPLIEEMQEAKESLSFEEFCGAMDALMKVLTPQEKNLVIFGNRKKRGESTDMSSSRSQSPGRPILDTYDRLMKHKRNLEEKLNEQRKHKVESIMQECTFKPKTRQKLEFEENLNSE